MKDMEYALWMFALASVGTFVVFSAWLFYFASCHDVADAWWMQAPARCINLYGNK